jgi:hypothetical protein
MVTQFDQNSHVHTRAFQIYMVLIGLAWNRQTITYGNLSTNQMEGFGTGGILDRPLNCIMRWCDSNNLPPLTVLVVNDETGEPGHGLSTVPGNKWPAAQQRVFGVNWFSFQPPTPSQLKAAQED